MPAKAKPGLFSKIKRFHAIEWTIVAIFLFQRFRNIGGVFTSQGIFPNGTDPYYRLHRMLAWLRTGSYPLHDPQLTAPQGFDVPWPMGLDMFLAFPLKLMHRVAPLWVEGFSSIMIPFIGLLTLYFVYDIARRTFGLGLAWFAALILAFFGAHIQSTSVGEVDHHVLESLFVIWILHALLLLREKNTTLRRWSVGILLGGTTFFWPQAWILSIMVFFAWVFDVENQNSSQWKEGAFIFGTSAVLRFCLALLSIGKISVAMSLFGISYFGAMLDTFLGAGCVVLSYIDENTSRLRAAAYGGAMVLLGGAVYLFIGSSIQTQMLAFLQTQKSFLALTAESGTIFSQDMGLFFTLAGIPWLVAFVSFLGALLWRKDLFWVGFSWVPLFLACLQWRLLYMASGLIAVWAPWGLWMILSHPSFKTPWRRTLVSSAFLLACLSPKLFQWQRTQDRNAHPQFMPVVEASRFLRTMPNGNVLAPWDFGHWILYYSGHSPVAHPFQSGVSIESTRVWISNGTKPLEAFRQKVPFQYLMVEAPTGKLKNWFNYFSMDASPYFQSDRKDIYALEPKPAFFDLMLPRYYFGLGVDEIGNGSRHWRLIHVSSMASRENPKLPALKVFEYVEGHPIKIEKLKPSHLYLLDATLQTSAGPERYRQYATSDARGEVAFHVPYEARMFPTVSFDGKYQLRDGDQPLRFITIP